MRILITVAFFLIFADGNACSCVHVGIGANKKSATFVFTGRVTEVSESMQQDTITGTKQLIEYRRIRYRFEIIRSFKGLEDKKTIDLFQGATDCEVTFSKGKKYLVYAYMDNRKLYYKLEDQQTDPYPTTHLCTRTKKIRATTFWETLVLLLAAG